MAAGDPLLDREFTSNLAARSCPVGVAVSGGGDSVALLLLLIDAIGADRLRAVTVDHGLRSESGREAGWVGNICARLSIPHTILRWTGSRQSRNLQEAARIARYDLIATWAASSGIGIVALGHTQDDVAETLLLGLSRGAGVSGLSAIRTSFRRNAVSFERPLLRASRASLRDLLREREQDWIEDPSNDDCRFDRVKVRRALAALAPLGLDAARLAQSARNLADTDVAIEFGLHDWCRDNVRIDHGDLLVGRAAFEALPTDFRRRIISLGIRWISVGFHPPRAAAILRLIDAGSGRLGGARLNGAGPSFRLGRDRTMVGKPVRVGEIWDHRWIVTGPKADDIKVRELGHDGLKAMSVVPENFSPRESLACLPALWRGDDLVACPSLDPDCCWHARLIPGRDRFPQGSESN